MVDMTLGASQMFSGLFKGRVTDISRSGKDTEIRFRCFQGLRPCFCVFVVPGTDFALGLDRRHTLLFRVSFVNDKPVASVCFGDEFLTPSKFIFGYSMDFLPPRFYAVIDDQGHLDAIDERMRKSKHSPSGDTGVKRQ